MCIDCGDVFHLPLSCECSNRCQQCTLRIISCSARSKGLWGQEIPACRIEGHSVPVAEALEIAKGTDRETEVEDLLEVLPTIEHLPGTTTCPDNCGYAGWVNSSQQCFSPVECEKCGKKWVEWKLLPLWYRCFRFFRDLYTGEHPLYNELCMKAWTIPCPLCQVYAKSERISNESVICPRCQHCYNTYTRPSVPAYSQAGKDARTFLHVLLWLLLVILTLCKVLYVAHQPGASSMAGLSLLLNIGCFTLAFEVRVCHCALDLHSDHDTTVLTALTVTFAALALGFLLSAYILGMLTVLKGSVMVGVAAAHCILASVYSSSR